MCFRVLHIENSPSQCAMVKQLLDQEYLGHEEYEYICAATLKSASEILSTTRVDVIIADLNLPDIKGTGAVAMAREACPDIPIIVLTCDDSRAAAKDAVRAGADAYVLKQHAETLPLIVLLTLERWALRKEKEKYAKYYTSIVEDGPDWIIRSLPNGKITFANHGFCEAFNRTQEDIVGHNLCEFLSKEQMAHHQDIRKTISYDNPNVKGNEFWMGGRLIQWRKTGIFDAKKRLVELQSIGRDVTDEYEMMRQLSIDAKKLVTTVSNQSGEMVDKAMVALQNSFRHLEGIKNAER